MSALVTNLISACLVPAYSFAIPYRFYFEEGEFFLGYSYRDAPTKDLESLMVEQVPTTAGQMREPGIGLQGLCSA